MRVQTKITLVLAAIHKAFGRVGGLFHQKDLIREVEEHRRAEAELMHRLMVERAVGEVSNMLVSEDTEDFGGVLAVLGRSVGADKAFIYSFGAAGKQDSVEEWCQPAQKAACAVKEGFEREVSPWLRERFAGTRSVAISDASELPDDAGAVKIFGAYGVRSLMAVPLLISGKLVGFMGLSSYTRRHGWTEEDASLLSAISEIIASYMLRRKTDAEMLKVMKLESLGLLAGGIAHDFNNILTAILGNLALAQSPSAGAETVKRRLAETEKATLRAKDLTQQLLTFSKGGMPVKKTASVGDLLLESASFMARGSNTLCEFAIAPDLSAADIDEGQITQVIHNLVINAEQAMPQGGRIDISAANVEVGSKVRLPLTSGNYIKIAVRDHGTGIPEDYLGQIFDPYFTTKKSGNGLGLATSYSIIKKHGGIMTVESVMGMGATFHIYLPASTKQPVKASAQMCRLRPHGGRVLVLDDEEIVRDVVGGMLEGMGYKVVTTPDAMEAIGFYREAKEAGAGFDAVIMDLTIPGGMGGKDALAEILKIDPNVRAIVSSGYSNDPVMAHHKEFGFRAAIAKPFQMRELREALDAALDGPSEDEASAA